MVFVSSRLTKASTSWAFHAANISRAIWRLSCPAMVSSLCSIDSTESLELRLRLLQPVRHSHLAVHRRRGGEVLLRLLALARARAELAEAEVAVGDEGAHLELFRHVQGVPVSRLRGFDVGRLTTRGQLAEKPERPRLMPSLFVLYGECQRA